MALDLCKELRVKAISGGFLVETPFKYYDHDSVVVFGRNQGGNRFRVSDNGDAAERLSFDGVDVGSERIGRWLAEAKAHFGIEWDAEGQEFWVECDASELASTVFRIAEAATQLQAMTVTRESHRESTFKSEMLSILREVAREANVDMRFDVPVVSHFIADALFLTEKPLAIVLAPTKDRLMEAELMWSTIQRTGDPTVVYAVVESVEKVGRKEHERAAFYTDKVLPFVGYASELRQSLLTSLRSH
jgi:hypothetical protein